MRLSQASRPIALVAVAAIAVAGLSGCSWFKKGAKGDYVLAPEMRPLEVPPDLTVPGSAGAVQPVTTTASAIAAAAAGPGFDVAGSRDDTFNRVGEALASIPGVAVTSKAQLLGAYDISYEGASFLVRVAAKGEGSTVSAVDPRGMPANGAAPVKLMAELKAKLGG